MNTNVRAALPFRLRAPERHSPIGVFDSGLGGLTVVKAIRRMLPGEDLVYYGDVARLPYGIKSAAQIVACSKSNTEFLLERGVKAVVVACNSSASTSLDTLHQFYRLPLIVDVIDPAVTEALRRTRSGRIGLLGTQATVGTGRYEQVVRQKDGSRKARIFAEAAPLLVPLVESGWLNDGITRNVLLRYLTPLRRRRIDTLILGCTHYAMLKPAIRVCLPASVTIVDAAPLVAARLQEGLAAGHLLRPSNGRRGKLRLYLSDIPQDFTRIGERFLGESLTYVKKVAAS